MAQTLTRLLVHIIFSTKSRAAMIPESIESELFAYIGGICRNHSSPLIAAGGTADHVHLLVSQSKNIALADLVQNIKKDSSSWLKTKPGVAPDFHWQDGYAAFSISESGVAGLREYFADQKRHHTKTSFQDELLRILRSYNVEFDERYLWAT